MADGKRFPAIEVSGPNRNFVIATDLDRLADNT